MANSSRAGQPAEPADLIDIDALRDAYYTTHPDISDPGQRVAFGTSGHRGSAERASFNEDHILATSQAIVEYRKAQRINGPLFLGSDSHALSEPALRTALEVFIANEVEVLIDPHLDRSGAAGADGTGLVPTPALSRAILEHNADRKPNDKGRADGVVVTPSHNPPTDGGFKYNPPDGGPADSQITSWVSERANQLLAEHLAGVKRVPLATAIESDYLGRYDFMDRYLAALPRALNLEVIRDTGLRIGADPLGGASVAYWGEIATRFGLDLQVTNPTVDPKFAFMSLDWDGKIRMDCSSASAMSSLISRQQEFDLATGNDTDADRHGIVTPDAGLMNPNHFLSVAVHYLAGHRRRWPIRAGIGKTLVSSSMIDRVVAAQNRKLVEVPVGFKWFVPGLAESSIAFGGEESAGASFLQIDGATWTTDKDGILLALLASEITAVTGRSPSMLYRSLTEQFGEPVYARIDSPATREDKQKLAALSAELVTATTLAGDPITARLTKAPGNQAPIGGLKVTTDNGWFAARPSGTEDVYKLYAESMVSAEHLAAIQSEAQQLLATALHG